MQVCAPPPMVPVGSYGLGWCGSRQLIAVTGYGTTANICRFLGTVFPSEPDPSTWGKARRRHAARFATESLGCIERDAGDYSTAMIGPLWADITSLCWLYGYVLAFEDAGRQARGRARHPLPFDVV